MVLIKTATRAGRRLTESRAEVKGAGLRDIWRRAPDGAVEPAAKGGERAR